MRIALVISSLGCGGAERVLTTLAGALASRGHHLALITLSNASTDFYTVPVRVERIALDVLSPSRNVLQAIGSNVRRILNLRRTLRECGPDAVLSFVEKTNILTLASANDLGVPVIISERIDPRFYDIGAGWNMLRRMAYPRATALVVQSESLRHWANRFVPNERVRVIPNPVRSNAGEQVRTDVEPTFLAMGRLTPQKGLDLLIRAFAKCVHAKHNWTLAIVGEGEERERLQRLADSLGVTSMVRLAGRTSDPTSWFNVCRVFVLSSRFEGFPNVLIEAMAAGVPCISFDCPSGPGEIIEDGVNGTLVRPLDIDGLARAMERLATDIGLRQKYSSAGLEVLTRFGLDHVAGIWEELLFEALANKQLHALA